MIDGAIEELQQLKNRCDKLKWELDQIYKFYGVECINVLLDLPQEAYTFISQLAERLYLYKEDVERLTTEVIQWDNKSTCLVDEYKFYKLALKLQYENPELNMKEFVDSATQWQEQYKIQIHYINTNDEEDNHRVLAIFRKKYMEYLTKKYTR